ncbi:MAG: hypothetical protein ACREEN_03620 [Stellaceae bacterium]
MGVLRLALAIAFCSVASGPALAGEPPATHSAIADLIVGLRQSVSASGARVLDEAEQWLSKLELGGGSAGDLRPGIGVLALEATGHVAARIAKIIPLGLDDAASANAAKRPTRLGLQELLVATVVNGDGNGSIGRVQSNLGAEIDDSTPLSAAYLGGNPDHGPAVGAALAELSLGGHDIELGLPLPALPEMHVTAARYWWGDRTFMPAVDGYRVGLSYDLGPHLQFEGGRSEDQVRGAAGFLGLHYSLPLDTERPAGVMLR